MTNMKATKRALVSSVLALFLCFAMLLGTTFAWFTDSVTSSGNIIKSGSLDIALEKWDGSKWIDASNDPIFNYDKWEPGYTQVVNLRVVNLGTLALKWQAIIMTEKELSKLADAINVYVRSDDQNDTVRAYIDSITDRTQFDTLAEQGQFKKFTLREFVEKITVMTNGTLVPKQESYLGIVLQMDPNAGNEYQGLDLGGKFDLQIFATQLASEEDSFGKDYDKDAAAFTVADANALLAQNKDVTLANCSEPNGVLSVPENYTGTLTLNNVNIASIQKADALVSLSATESVNEIKIVIKGNVVVKAIAEGQSAITGNALNISGTGNLTAIGKGKAAFGIGGMETTSIKIEGITIDYVAGGFVYGVGSDTKYYKDAPEGGAAIGSGADGAVITLNKVMVNEAIGGSKCAAIGARYHIGVTVNITDSAIVYAEGGVSAAAIGGSRVSKERTESGTTVNIKNSTVNAKGGVYGAGIGSGYDTHCNDNQPICTINIEDSTINAEGGQYAAGVGTGYHNAALAGEIKNTKITAKSGDKFYKDTYTSAMDIGFGVVDPTREGKQTGSKLIVNGVTVVIPAPGKAVANAEELLAALQNGGNYALSENITLDSPLEINAAIGINLNGKTLTVDEIIVNNGFEIGGNNSGSIKVDTLNVSSSATVKVKNCEIVSSTTNNSGTIEVYGETTLKIAALTGNSLDLCEGAIIKDSAVGGPGYVAGNVTFRGDNTFTMLTDYGDYYSSATPSKWNVENGGSLTLTQYDRYGLGYGDVATVTGSIADALTARDGLTDADASINMYGGLVGMTNSAAPNANNSFVANNAYLIFGVKGDKSFGNKPGNYYGNYKMEFNNSVVTANGFKFYEDKGTSTVIFNGSDLYVNGVLMTNDKSSTYTFTNSVVFSKATNNGSDDKNQNAGEMTLIGTKFTYSAKFTNIGTLKLDVDSVLTAPSIAGNGKIVIDATGATGDSVQLIVGDMTGFTGEIEVVGADYTAVATTSGLSIVSANN